MCDSKWRFEYVELDYVFGLGIEGVGYLCIEVVFFVFICWTVQWTYNMSVLLALKLY